MPSQLDDWELREIAVSTAISTIYRAGPVRAAADQPGAYAVKVLRPELNSQAWAVALMRREALVGRRTASSHVVAVLSASVAEAPYYLVMPWLAGETLQARLARWPLLPVHGALWIARQAAIGLSALDAQGWIHGDLKPANILLAPEGHVTLLDLGFARRPGEAIPALEGCLLGTAAYLPPESLVPGMKTDIRSDLYSLGVVLYEMLSGGPPFDGSRPSELARQHKQTAAPPLAKRAPHVPAQVATLVHSLLAKDPLRRPQTPGELLDRLTALEIVTLRQWIV